MSKLIKTFLLFSTMLIIGCVSGPADNTFASAQGEWKTQFITIKGSSTSPKMTIIDETRATYAFWQGRIFFYATDNQGKWEGYWVESYAANISCTEKKDGSYVWGVVVFQFNDSYTSFSGDWDACGIGKKYPWSGNRS